MGNVSPLPSQRLHLKKKKQNKRELLEFNQLPAHLHKYILYFNCIFLNVIGMYSGDLYGGRRLRWIVK